MLVGFGSLHGKFSLNSGQNFAVLVQYRVPGVVPFFEFWDSLILENGWREHTEISSRKRKLH